MGNICLFIYSGLFKQQGELLTRAANKCEKYFLVSAQEWNHKNSRHVFPITVDLVVGKCVSIVCR